MTAIQSLRDRVKENSEFFDHMLDLIPAKFYLHPEQSEEDLIKGNRYLHNKQKPSKEVLEKIKDAKKKAKRDKLDPESASAQSTAAVQQRLLSTVKPVSTETNTELTKPKASESGVALSGSELRERLQAKINQLQQRRLGAGSSSITSTNSAANISPKQNGSLSVSKTRQQILEERQRKKLLQKEAQRQEKLRIGQTVSGSKRPREDSQQQREPDQKNHLSFNKVDFGDKKKKVKLDPHIALKRVEAEQSKLQAIKQTDSEKAKIIEEAKKWTKVMSMAQGEKQQDDIKLLKKSAKRKDKKKSKTTQAWSERVDTVKNQQMEKQKKRHQNIQARIDQKKQTKIQKRQKRAGF